MSAKSTYKESDEKLVEQFSIIRQKRMISARWEEECDKSHITGGTFDRNCKLLLDLGIVKKNIETREYFCAVVPIDEKRLHEYNEGRKVHSKYLVQQIQQRIEHRMFPFNKDNESIRDLRRAYSILTDPASDLVLSHPDNLQLEGLCAVAILSYNEDDNIFYLREHLNGYVNNNRLLPLLESTFKEIGEEMRSIFNDIRSYNFYKQFESAFSDIVAIQLEDLTVRLLLVPNEDLDFTSESIEILDSNKYPNLYEEINRIVQLYQKRRPEHDSFALVKDYLKTCYILHMEAMGDIHDKMREPFMDAGHFYKDLSSLFSQVNELNHILVGECRLCREE